MGFRITMFAKLTSFHNYIKHSPQRCSTRAYQIITEPASVSARLEIPTHIIQPPYVQSQDTFEPSMDTSQSNISCVQGKLLENIRTASRVAADALKFAESLVQIGLTTDSLDRAVHRFIVAANAYPSPLGYHGFLKSICTSINNVIVHGIPDSRPLQEGDIVNIDVSVYMNGVHGLSSSLLLSFYLSYHFRFCYIREF